MALADCICAEVPRVPTRTRVLVLRHVLERMRASNSARLAALALPSCEIVEYALPGVAPNWERLEESGTVLLYPGGDTAVPSDVRQLVVLDGSWSQARRMTQRIPELRRLPRLSLCAPAANIARLRRPPREGHMATLEAIARALELLEGPEVARPLDALFAEAVRRQRALGWHET